MTMQGIVSKAGRRGPLFCKVTAPILLLLALLGACQGNPPQVADADGSADGTMVQYAAPAGLIEIDPLDPDQAAAPSRLEIPAIGLDAPVTPMGWRVVTMDGQRTTLWDVPMETAGWHVNSAGAGAAGNAILSGRQADGEALFAPLALGSIEPGQEVRLTDEDGLVFVYRVREVSDPIPISGATEEEKALAETYLSSGDEAQLTLITGWPEFTTTHRVFAVADFLGTVN
jgi:hypothetical protein